MTFDIRTKVIFSKALSFTSRFARSSLAISYGRKSNIPGIQFADFGRRIGWKLLSVGDTLGLSLLCSPVSIVRYFEFQFCHDASLLRHGHFLDVASPFLFSLSRAEANTDRDTITMINPDFRDYLRTKRIFFSSGIHGINVVCSRVETWLSNMSSKYDGIWSLSVIEHIWPEHGDINAIKLMWRAIKPGGFLVVTVPVDRHFKIENRSTPAYGLVEHNDGLTSYPFQRWYDEPSLRNRIWNAVGQEPERIAWFGERISGWWQRYEDLWRSGSDIYVEDPQLIADWFCEYRSFQEMPGCGVVGMMFVKR